MALAEIVNETKFLHQVQEFIMPTLRSCTISIMEDNQGAIKMTNNKHSSRRTRHIDVKHHIVRDAVEKGLIRIVYVMSEEQHADILTKALDMRTFELHAKALMNLSRYEGMKDTLCRTSGGVRVVDALAKLQVGT